MTLSPRVSLLLLPSSHPSVCSTQKRRDETVARLRNPALPLGCIWTCTPEPQLLLNYSQPAQSFCPKEPRCRQAHLANLSGCSGRNRLSSEASEHCCRPNRRVTVETAGPSCLSGCTFPSRTVSMSQRSYKAKVSLLNKPIRWSWLSRTLLCPSGYCSSSSTK